MSQNKFCCENSGTLSPKNSKFPDMFEMIPSMLWCVAGDDSIDERDSPFWTFSIDFSNNSNSDKASEYLYLHQK